MRRNRIITGQHQLAGRQPRLRRSARATRALLSSAGRQHFRPTRSRRIKGSRRRRWRPRRHSGSGGGRSVGVSPDPFETLIVLPALFDIKSGTCSPRRVTGSVNSVNKIVIRRTKQTSSLPRRTRRATANCISTKSTKERHQKKFDANRIRPISPSSRRIT